MLTTTLEVIYENGIFRPISSVPQNFREHEKLKIIIENNYNEELESEFAQWEQASDEDFIKIEESLGVKS
jgi:predicted DNA-binding antitoxin AbrB/MazE fold protein